MLLGYTSAFENHIEKDCKVEHTRGHILVLRNGNKWIDLFRLCGFEDINTTLLSAEEVRIKRNSGRRRNLAEDTNKTTGGEYNPDWKRKEKEGIGYLVFSVQKKNKDDSIKES